MLGLLLIRYVVDVLLRWLFICLKRIRNLTRVGYIPAAFAGTIGVVQVFMYFRHKNNPNLGQ